MSYAVYIILYILVLHRLLIHCPLTILHSLSSLDEESWVAFHKQWIETSLDWFESIGLQKELMSYAVYYFIYFCSTSFVE